VRRRGAGDTQSSLRKNSACDISYKGVLTRCTFATAHGLCIAAHMNISAQNILVYNESFNECLAGLRQGVDRQTAQVHRRLRHSVCASTRADKTANAFLRNAVSCFRLEPSRSRLLATIGAPMGVLPRLPVDVRALHVPARFIRPFGPAGVLLAGTLLVGNCTGPRPASAGIAGSHAFKGAVGWVVQGLNHTSGRASDKGWTRCGQACLWGAALIAAVCTVVRAGVFALDTSLAIGFGICGAMTAGLLAAVVQIARSADSSVVDFTAATEAWLQAHLARP
jgi:hypothetical protein